MIDYPRLKKEIWLSMFRYIVAIAIIIPLVSIAMDWIEFGTLEYIDVKKILTSSIGLIIGYTLVNLFKLEGIRRGAYVTEISINQNLSILGVEAEVQKALLVTPLSQIDKIKISPKKKAKKGYYPYEVDIVYIDSEGLYRRTEMRVNDPQQVEALRQIDV